MSVVFAELTEEQRQAKQAGLWEEHADVSLQKPRRKIILPIWSAEPQHPDQWAQGERRQEDEGQLCLPLPQSQLQPQCERHNLEVVVSEPELGARVMSARELPIKTSKQDVTVIEPGKSRRRVGVGGKPQEEQLDPDLLSHLLRVQRDGLTHMGEVRRNIQCQLEETQVNFQSGMNLLQDVIESNNKRIQASMGQISSTMNTVESTLQKMEYNLATINSSFLQLQGMVESGFRELSQEISALVKCLSQNLVSGSARNQVARPVLKLGERIPL
ncbi:family with sequence similarity 216 member A isoform X4 [Callorhinchus milii]|uniref:family with sequence similarity 216 member A isoform X4 n=1 Tax=Callorhinchus milii TaxID=7868 RepID=UPI00045740D0|nr:family with sequence similarity 216 member A isoform X4 [Callorhinchus milii]|eukprot:gi/632968287/ref/XP_007900443.1/ PREDICTED: uncharacterized protein LOC103184318 [Callorhinchus milii]